MSTTRLTVVTHELPYPADHGGKVDIWNRLVGLSHLGVELQLITWADGGNSIHAAVEQAVDAVVHDAVVLRRNVIRALRWRGRHPPRMLTYSVTRADLSQLARAVSDFGSNAIMLESWPAYLTAKAIASSVKRPLLYRSQNVEHLYLTHQAALARGLQRWKLLFNGYGFQRIEADIRRNAAIVFDICGEDSAHWLDVNGMSPTVVLLPTWLGASSLSREVAIRDIDLLFAGNLWTSNNVDGLFWFIEGVLPHIRAATGMPLRVVFAGSYPSARLIRACEAAQIECVANPEDIDALTRRARVAINPVRHSSGVNIKMLTLLASGAHIVASKAAIRGLPLELAGLCGISSEPAQFARYVVEALSNESQVDMRRRSDALERHCGGGALSGLVNSVALLARRDPACDLAPSTLSLA